MGRSSGFSSITALDCGLRCRGVCEDRSLGLDTDRRGTARRTAQGLGNPDEKHRKGGKVSEVGPPRWGQKRKHLRLSDDGEGVSDHPTHLKYKDRDVLEGILSGQRSKPLNTEQPGHIR